MLTSVNVEFGCSPSNLPQRVSAASTTTNEQRGGRNLVFAVEIPAGRAQCVKPIGVVEMRGIFLFSSHRREFRPHFSFGDKLFFMNLGVG